ncbi:MAG: histidine ammonia-lyase [Psychromonas sp.]|jgi:histidine ammonia-lyase
MSQWEINPEWVSLERLELVLSDKKKLKLSEESKKAIVKCRVFLDKKVTETEDLIYGINTGFGSLCDTAISISDLEKLQKNLVLSHACGTGEEIESHIVKRILLLKILGLSHGHSGVQLATIERLIYFYNEEIYPVIYSQGSLGASGDLAPLAHMSLALIGEGKVRVNGVKTDTATFLKSKGLEPIVLRSKEGLALLNGTQFMSAFASYAVANGMKLYNQFNLIGALSLEGFDGRSNPFKANVNGVRMQHGQIHTAAELRRILEGSELITRKKNHVQDPYSYRCMPQVHGASKDTLDFCWQIVEREINAVTDNPTVFPEDDEIVSAGNFHGQPLALIMDYLAIAIAELGSISERRVYKLIGGTRGLPAFLVANPGLNSGFMIPQYTMASIVSQNKQLCTPASVDTIDSSNGQEDHVSMGANAATKLYRVIQNAFQIQGIELMNAAQALEFRRPAKTSQILEKLVSDYRKVVPFVEQDLYFHELMIESKLFVEKLK